MLAFILTAVLAGMQAATVPQTARIAGQVVDDATGKPIAGAGLIPDAHRTAGRPGRTTARGAITDDDGHFTFEGVTPGGYNLQVSKAGFAPAPKNALIANVGVGPGETKNDLRLALERGGAIAGRVVDASGNPLAEVRVVPMRPTTTGQTAMLMPVGQNVQTNDLGEFRAYRPSGKLLRAGHRTSGLPDERRRTAHDGARTNLLPRFARPERRTSGQRDRRPRSPTSSYRCRRRASFACPALSWTMPVSRWSMQ